MTELRFIFSLICMILSLEKNKEKSMKKVVIDFILFFFPGVIITDLITDLILNI